LQKKKSDKYSSISKPDRSTLSGEVSLQLLPATNVRFWHKADVRSYSEAG